MLKKITFLTLITFQQLAMCTETTPKGPFFNLSEDQQRALMSVFCKKILTGHTSAVHNLAFNCDGTKIASGSSDTTARVWDVKTGEQVQCLNGHTDIVRNVMFTLDSSKLVSAADDKTVRLWDIEAGAQLQCLKVNYRDKVIFAPDDTLSIYEPDNKESSSDSNDVTKSATPTQVSQKRQLGDADVRRISNCNHDRTKIAIGYSSIIKIFDNRTNESLMRMNIINKGYTYNPVYSVAFNHDSTKLVSGSYDCIVRLWKVNASDGVLLKEFHGHSHYVESVAFNRDSTKIASASSDETIRVWDVESGEQLICLTGHTDRVRGIAFSPNYALLASASSDKTVRIWDFDAIETELERIELLKRIEEQSSEFNKKLTHWGDLMMSTLEQFKSQSSNPSELAHLQELNSNIQSNKKRKIEETC